MNLVGPNNRIIVQISQVRREIRALHVQKKTMPSAVYYDQLEELSATLAKLKDKQIKRDVLDVWCVQNPSDFECRVYDT